MRKKNEAISMGLEREIILIFEFIRILPILVNYV